MNELIQTSKLVKEILTECEAARNSDIALYIRVCEKLNPSVLCHPFVNVIGSLKEYGLPPFETVRRTRQKMQEKFPELASAAKVAEMRSEKEEDFRRYAREG